MGVWDIQGPPLWPASPQTVLHSHGWQPLQPSHALSPRAIFQAPVTLLYSGNEEKRGKGAERSRRIDQKTAQSFDQNVSRTTMLDQASTMEKRTEPAIPTVQNTCYFLMLNCNPFWPGLLWTCIDLHSLWPRSYLHVSERNFFTIWSANPSQRKQSDDHSLL